MTTQELFELFETFDDEYGKFDLVKNPKHSKRDLCAMLMLDELVSGKGKRIIACSEHDHVYLAIDCDELCNRLDELGTEEVVRDLVRCGVIYDQKINSLYILT